MGPAGKRNAGWGGVRGFGGHLLFGVVADLEVDVLYCAFELEEEKGETQKQESQLKQVETKRSGRILKTASPSLPPSNQSHVAVQAMNHSCGLK